MPFFLLFCFGFFLSMPIEQFRNNLCDQRPLSERKAGDRQENSGVPSAGRPRMHGQSVRDSIHGRSDPLSFRAWYPQAARIPGAETNSAALLLAGEPATKVRSIVSATWAHSRLAGRGRCHGQCGLASGDGAHRKRVADNAACIADGRRGACRSRTKPVIIVAAHMSSPLAGGRACAPLRARRYRSVHMLPSLLTG